MSAQSVSLIITTYNRPDALSLVLRSAAAQKRLPEEVIVADDGSGAETFAVIEKFQKNFPCPLKHAWQEDAGFRLARSRNNAVRQADGEYLVFIDGDTVLHPQFIADHLRLAEKNVFTVGSRVLLDEKATQAALAAQQFRFSFLETGAAGKIKALHLPQLGNMLYRPKNQPVHKLIFKIRGCNMGFWREDCAAVNGFNQQMEGWGREDSEFAARLFKKGLSLKALKFAAIQYHLYHAENDRAALPKNDAILQQTLAQNGFRCADGLVQD